MSSVTVQGPTCLTPCKTGFHMWVFPASPIHWESNIKRSQHRSLTLVSQRIRNDSFLTQTEGASTQIPATTWTKEEGGVEGWEGNQVGLIWCPFQQLPSPQCPQGSALPRDGSLLSGHYGQPYPTWNTFLWPLEFWEKEEEKAESLLLVNITLFLSAAFTLLTIFFWKAFFPFLGGGSVGG